MRKLALVLVVAGLLSLAQAGQAADLQAGWYAKVGVVGVLGTDPVSGHDFGIDWVFTGPPGATGPFNVTQPTDPDPLFPQFKVSVDRAVAGVADGTAVDLCGQFASPLPAAATRLDVAYETNYLSSQMILQLYVRHSSGQSEFLWSEPRPGHHLGSINVLGQWRSIAPTDSIYFRVVAVPEPPTYLALLSPSMGLLWIRRRASR